MKGIIFEILKWLAIALLVMILVYQSTNSNLAKRITKMEAEVSNLKQMNYDLERMVDYLIHKDVFSAENQISKEGNK